MGKPTGFLEWERAAPHRRPASLRVLDWREVDAPDGDAREQAGRCMDCGVPFCTAGCPLGNPIPEFADAVWHGRWRDAAAHLAVTNDFPELTGRLCPAPCEGACVLGIDGAPVTIESLEKSISDRAFAEGWVVPDVPAVRTGRHVAIVGSGPAGLAAAARLNRLGHTVTVFEAAPKAGGLLRYGIPDFKLDKSVLDRRLALLEAEGIELRCGVEVGVAPTWSQLRLDHDAVVIATGAPRARDLDVPGRDLAGVMLAMDYLTSQNRALAGESLAGHLDLRGQHVVILGGGDTGSDCLGTALRQGAASVIQLELQPAPPVSRAASNPWPAWPLVFRTSSSQEEGGTREFAIQTTHLEGADGRLVALHGTRLDTGASVRIPCQALILALGFTGPDLSTLVSQLGVALTARQTLHVDAAYATTVSRVFCVGDAHRGASLIVWALAEGRDCATSLSGTLSTIATAVPRPQNTSH